MEYFKLNNGVKIPKVGIGTNTFGKIDNNWSAPINMDTKELIDAFSNGYRLIDTAIMYRNEMVIGKAVKESKIPRSEFMITSKISAKVEYIRDEQTIEDWITNSLNHIGSYIDLYLIHHPSDDNEENLRLWKVLEKHYLQGDFKAIGVSNFNIEQLSYLINHATIKPMVNQIESNPSNWNHDIIKFCLNNDCMPEAWGPLDPAPNKELLIEIGKKYHKSWAQVLLRYQIERGVVVIPKSHNKQRQLENISIFDFKLSSEDVALIEG